MQLIDPVLPQFLAGRGHDFVGPGVSPSPSVPGAQQLRPRLLARMLLPPFDFVPGDVRAYLRRPGAERTSVRRQLVDLTVLVEGEPVSGEDRAELGVTHHGCVTDAVQRGDRVAQADSV